MVKSKTRKFKKKPVLKQRSKAEPILSISLIRKETLEKITKLWSRLISKAKDFKLTI